MENLCPYYWVYPPAKDTRSPDQKELTQLMKEATLELHEKSDNLVNMKLLLALTDRVEYGQVCGLPGSALSLPVLILLLHVKALGLFYCVFQCLDQTLKTHMLEVFQASNLESLLSSRVPSFEKDLEAYLGPEWATAVDEHCRPHAKSYCAHLNILAERYVECRLRYRRSRVDAL